MFRHPCLSSVVFATIALCGAPAWARTLNVPGDYSTVQAAVDGAFSGDTIVAGRGIYNEVVNVYKPELTVRADHAILIGSIAAHAAGVRIENWTIFPSIDNQGIQLADTVRAVAENNVIVGTYEPQFRAIWIDNCQSCSAKNNKIVGPYLYDGIGLRGNLAGTEVENNELLGTGAFGMYFFDVTGGTIRGNHLDGFSDSAFGGTWDKTTVFKNNDPKH